LITAGLSLVFGLLVDAAFPHASERVMEFYVSPILTLLTAVIATFIMLQAWDRRPWADIGLGLEHARPKLLTEGFLLGAAAIGIPSLLLISTSELRLLPAMPGNSIAAAALGVITFLPAAFFEELIMRGYIFMVLREAFGWRAGLFVTSVVFGLMHLGNPGVDAESVLLVILAGFFLGAIFLATRSLFAAGMAHFGWNWTMASVLHTSVSGIDVPSPDFKVVDNGPDWLTGGQWGPEGGIAAGFGMMVVFTYLYARRIRRMES
jgi:membrane protease YdiL (CAAX protease family)